MKTPTGRIRTAATFGEVQEARLLAQMRALADEEARRQAATLAQVAARDLGSGARLAPLHFRAASASSASEGSHYSSGSTARTNFNSSEGNAVNGLSRLSAATGLMRLSEGETHAMRRARCAARGLRYDQKSRKCVAYKRRQPAAR